MSSSDVVQFIVTVREQTSRLIAELPDQPLTLPETPPMITNGDGLYEANLRLVLRYLKHVNKESKRQGAPDSSAKVSQHCAMIKQLHDMDGWPAKMSLPFDIPNGIKEVAQKVSTAEELRQSLNAAWPTTYTDTSAANASTNASSVLPVASSTTAATKAPSKVRPQHVIQAIWANHLNRRERKTVAPLTTMAKGLVSDTSIADELVENGQVLTSEDKDIISTETCKKEASVVEAASVDATGVDTTKLDSTDPEASNVEASKADTNKSDAPGPYDGIAFKFKGKSGDMALIPSPANELKKFRFRHASDSLTLKFHGINNNSPQKDRAVSLPIRYKNPMQSCFLQCSGETLEEFIRGVEVDDAKLDNKMRWLALLQQPEAITFLGRWPSVATLKDFMQMHRLEWVVRVRGKWDWESKMADAQKSTPCNIISHENPSDATVAPVPTVNVEATIDDDASDDDELLIITEATGDTESSVGTAPTVKHDLSVNTMPTVRTDSPVEVGSPVETGIAFENDLSIEFHSDESGLSIETNPSIGTGPSVASDASVESCTDSGIHQDFFDKLEVEDSIEEHGENGLLESAAVDQDKSENHEAEDPVEEHDENKTLESPAVDQDGFDNPEVEDSVEEHDETTPDELAAIDQDAAKDDSSSNPQVPGSWIVKESPTEEFVATEPAVVTPNTPSWSVTAILAGAAASATTITVFCPALTAVLLYIGISWAKSRLYR